MRSLITALALLAACSSEQPPAPPPADAALLDAPTEGPLCSVGASERCDPECIRGNGYRRCVDGPAWSRCFCEEPDASAEAGPDAAPDVVDAGSLDADVDDATTPDADAACETRCDGACVDTGFDPFNCGGCGVRCMAPAPHTRAQCFAGRCERPCEADYDDCNGNLADGCETFLRGTDRANCGSCRGACAVTERCAMGVCRPL